MAINKNNHDDTASKGVVLAVATVASFVTPFMGSAISIALPSIGQEFGMDAVLLSWVATSYLLAAAVFLLPLGRVADIYGRKLVFTWGMVIYVVSTLLAAFSTSGIMLISFRVLQGIGSAMTFGTGVAILTSVFPVGERGKALGISVAAVYLGLALGPFIGGFLTQYFGWQSIFLALVPLGLVVIVLIFWKLKGEWAEARGESFDTVGSVVYGLGLVALIYGFSTLPAMSAVWLVVAGVLGIVGFVRWEMKVKSPILNVGLFINNRVFAFSNLAALINYSATFAVTFLMSLYLQYIKGLSPQQAGLIIVVMPAVQAVFSPLAGRLSDKIEPRVIASAGMVLTAIGLALLILLNEDTALGFVMGSLLVLGLGFALFSSPNTNAIMGSVASRYYGVSSAMVAVMRLIGQMLSMGIAMLLLALYMGRIQITPEYYPLFLQSVNTAFIIFTSLCVLGIFASLARGKVK